MSDTPLIEHLRNAVRTIEPQYRLSAIIYMNDNTRKALAVEVTDYEYEQWQRDSEKFGIFSTTPPPVPMLGGAVAYIYGVSVETDNALPDGAFTVSGGAA